MWSEPGGLRKARQPVGGFSGWPGLFAQPPSQHMTKPQNLTVMRSQVLDVEPLYGPTAPTSEQTSFREGWPRMTGSPSQGLRDVV